MDDTSLETWRRAQEQLAQRYKSDNPTVKHLYLCQYPDCEAAYKTLNHLEEHIDSELQDIENLNTKHYRAMLADGWNNDEINETIKNNIKRLRDHGLNFTLPKAAPPTQVPGRPGVFTGNYHGNEGPVMPSRLALDIFRGDEAGADVRTGVIPIPAYLQGSVFHGTPAHLRDHHDPGATAQLQDRDIWRGNNPPPGFTSAGERIKAKPAEEDVEMDVDSDETDSDDDDDMEQQ